MPTLVSRVQRLHIVLERLPQRRRAQAEGGGRAREKRREGLRQHSQDGVTDGPDECGGHRSSTAGGRVSACFLCSVVGWHCHASRHQTVLFATHTKNASVTRSSRRGEGSELLLLLCLSPDTLWQQLGCAWCTGRGVLKRLPGLFVRAATFPHAYRPPAHARTVYWPVREGTPFFVVPVRYVGVLLVGEQCSRGAVVVGDGRRAGSLLLSSNASFSFRTARLWACVPGRCACAYSCSSDLPAAASPCALWRWPQCVTHTKERHRDTVLPFPCSCCSNATNRCAVGAVLNIQVGPPTAVFEDTAYPNDVPWCHWTTRVLSIFPISLM